MKAALLSLIALQGADGIFLRNKQEPDESCGKGYERLVPGSKKWFGTAQQRLWEHPGQVGNDDTFEQELQCWYANMISGKCGGLPSKYETRNAKLTQKCSGVGEDWLKVWGMFSLDEINFYKDHFPGKKLKSGDQKLHYKQALKTALDLNKREILCMTLFIIDDECGAHEYIRMADNQKAAAAQVALVSQNVVKQSPDTSCGKSFENLVPGSKDYFKTAQEKLWLHPGQTGQEDTFESELQCWYANMVTGKCGGMPSQYKKRNAKLTEQCTGVGQDWLQVWKQFSPAEVQYYKKNFPAEPIEEGNPIHYKQGLKTALDLNKREILCMTLFLIDDECGAHSHIRMTNNGKEAALIEQKGKRFSGTSLSALITQSAKQEPDTSCGKGFEKLVPGSKDYFATAQETLWTHPGQTGQEDTFEQELQCWYASMLSSQCGGMKSQYEARNAKLTEMCTGVGQDWLQVWKLFSPAEVQYYKKDFPAAPISEDDPTHYKQAVKTALDLNKREILCMTLFVIDDDCGAHSHIRVAKA